MDEITEFEGDAAPVITDLVAADLSAAGIPIPAGLTKEVPSANIMTRFIEALTNIFKSNSNSNDQMNPETNQPKAQQQEQTPTVEQHEQQDTTVTAEAHASAIAAKDTEIANLKAEIEALKKAPGDSTSHIVDNKPNGSGEQKNVDPSSPEAFYETRQRAQALFDMLPH